MKRIVVVALVGWVAGAVGAAGRPSQEGSAGQSMGRIDVGHLPLTVLVTEGARCSALGSTVLVSTEGTVFSVGDAEQDPIRSLRAARRDAKTVWDGENIEGAEIDGGWVLRFTNEGSAGTNYWVRARLEIGGKSYLCRTTANTPSQAEEADRACRTLQAK